MCNFSSFPVHQGNHRRIMRRTTLTVKVCFPVVSALLALFTAGCGQTQKPADALVQAGPAPGAAFHILSQYGSGSPIVVVGGSIKARAAGKWLQPGTANPCTASPCASTGIDTSVLTLDNVQLLGDALGPVGTISWGKLTTQWTITVHTVDSNASNHGLSFTSGAAPGPADTVTMAVITPTDDALVDAPVNPDRKRKIYQRNASCTESTQNQKRCEAMGTIDVAWKISGTLVTSHYQCIDGECGIYIGQ